MSKESLSVGVFCSASDVADKYTEPAREFARLIGEHGHRWFSTKGTWGVGIFCRNSTCSD